MYKLSNFKRVNLKAVCMVVILKKKTQSFLCFSNVYDIWISLEQFVQFAFITGEMWRSLTIFKQFHFFYIVYGGHLKNGSHFEIFKWLTGFLKITLHKEPLCKSWCFFIWDFLSLVKYHKRYMYGGHFEKNTAILNFTQMFTTFE